MKFSMFNPWPVYGVQHGPDWPVSPGLSRPDDTRLGMRRGIEISTIADRVGFDYVTVAEHHYHPRQLSPNPLLSAAALSQHLTRAGVAVLGATLPLVNPIRTAEEVCMVDALTNGNMIIGMFRGTPNEYLTYGTNPSETREVFEEAVSLIVRAWTEPEPFAWIGRHYDFRTVAVWPRPVSYPHPPVLVSANSPASAVYAAHNHFRVGVAFAPAERTVPLVKRFVDEAESLGYTPPAEHILHRSFCLVADTDEEAERLVTKHQFGDMSAVFAASDDYGVNAALREAIAAGDAKAPAVGGTSNPPPIGRRAGPPRGGKPQFYGSPDTVASKIHEFAEQTGVGHFDLLFNDVMMDYDVAARGVELFGAEVLPRLQGSVVAV